MFTRKTFCLSMLLLCLAGTCTKSLSYVSDSNEPARPQGSWSIYAPRPVR